MRHEITEDIVKAYASTHRAHLASCGGEGSSKRLEIEMPLEGRYIVTDHGKEVYAGTSLADAVTAYNAAP